MRKILLILMLGMVAVAAEAPKTPAQQLLEKVMQAYVDLKSGVVTASIKIHDDKMQATEQSELRLMRPKKMYFHTHFTPSDKPAVDDYVVTDGKEIFLYDTNLPKQYLAGKLPDPIRVIDLPNQGFYLGPGNFFLNLMTGEADKVLQGRKLELKDGNILRLIADESVDEWTIDPATNRAVQVTNYVDGKPIAEGTITYARVNEEIPDSEFQFTPPEGAERKDIERQE